MNSEEASGSYEIYNKTSPEMLFENVCCKNVRIVEPNIEKLLISYCYEVFDSKEFSGVEKRSMVERCRNKYRVHRM